MFIINENKEWEDIDYLPTNLFIFEFYHNCWYNSLYLEKEIHIAYAYTFRISQNKQNSQMLKYTDA